MKREPKRKRQTQSTNGEDWSTEFACLDAELVFSYSDEDIIDSRKLTIAVLIAMQFLWPTMHEPGFATWSDVQYSTLAVMDLSEAAVSEMQRFFFLDISDPPRCRRFRTRCVFGMERSCVSNVQEASPRSSFQGHQELPNFVWTCASSR